MLEIVNINAVSYKLHKMYPDSDKYFPPNALSPRGNPIQVSYFVVSDHAIDKITQCSQSDIIL